MSTTSPVHQLFDPLLSQTAQEWRDVVDRELRPHGLTQTIWLALLRLARSEMPMRQKDLAVSLFLDSSTVVHLLDDLQSTGLVERREGPDRRSKTIHLTPLGEATVERVDRIARKVREGVLAGIPDEDIDKVFGVLDHICNELSLRARDRLA
jgi:MarR family transcriptional regulator, transcriptional regulator for hemolysin